MYGFFLVKKLIIMSMYNQKLSWSYGLHNFRGLVKGHTVLFWDDVFFPNMFDEWYVLLAYVIDLVQDDWLLLLTLSNMHCWPCLKWLSGVVDPMRDDWHTLLTLSRVCVTCIVDHDRQDLVWDYCHAFFTTIIFYSFIIICLYRVLFAIPNLYDHPSSCFWSSY